ncbi:enoyl-CoA hydratase [Gordonia amarae]|uniref:Enoyl-CoA hydratase n=2 Tax=Gordonia amarae TaxID=36821 RepID=A0A857MB90_9ACTN|nr:MaoC/PaaZ C-terminal domain-containing protein [Gordonia amarae]MCS3878182.1 acyl dehydratase [Gordonia amarae]QHN16850.1 enoyl-CoA hydratase [Gordonia amarae]QHN21375.1 enoyl-CoA hydratase [Gordonia amarae]QHN30228.1 enoyl-CoA hydratase [Gordonia amarae]QHN39002.1 enoyl-CoA hydratase [Gordonia amarae]
MSIALPELKGVDLGESTATIGDRDIILYALALGAPSTQLDLVYERELRALPTYACALGLWAVEAAGRLGAYDPKRSLHASQRLVVHQPLPTDGTVQMTGQIAAVYDKGKASMVEIEVSSPYFTASYSIFLPGTGGWGGDRGPSSSAGERPALTAATDFATGPDLAALYRLTGDRHPIHIDPVVAEANGFARPILHGLCTAGIASRIIAQQHGFHPADLVELEVRLAAPVLPGDCLTVSSATDGDIVVFETTVGDSAVLTGGRARFA